MLIRRLTPEEAKKLVFDDDSARAQTPPAGEKGSRRASRWKTPAPTLDQERGLWDAGHERVVGVDDVGTEAICSAIVVGAVELAVGSDPELLTGLRDSKQISQRARQEALAQRVTEVARRYALGAASAREIEQLGGERAHALAIERALRRIGDYDIALIDGGGVLGLMPDPRHRFLVRGDALSLSIAAASLVAKVTHDRLLSLLARRYPGYSWEKNAGYATPQHREGLATLGPTPHHHSSNRVVRRSLQSV